MVRFLIFLTHSCYFVALANSNLFFKVVEKKLAIVLVYVNDVILTGDCKEEILLTKKIFQFASR